MLSKQQGGVPGVDGVRFEDIGRMGIALRLDDARVRGDGHVKLLLLPGPAEFIDDDYDGCRRREPTSAGASGQRKRQGLGARLRECAWISCLLWIAPARQRKVGAGTGPRMLGYDVSEVAGALGLRPGPAWRRRARSSKSRRFHPLQVGVCPMTRSRHAAENGPGRWRSCDPSWGVRCGANAKCAIPANDPGSGSPRL
jgi:hypothetical protein